MLFLFLLVHILIKHISQYRFFRKIRSYAEVQQLSEAKYIKLSFFIGSYIIWVF